MQMDLKELTYIAAIAKYNSLSKASEAVFITPSALSKFISNLESRYKIKIFDRVGKQFTLTYAGERYLYWLEQQAKILEKMETEISDIADARDGKFKIGIPTTCTTQYYIENVAAVFQKKYPNIELDIIESYGNDLCKLQGDNQLDYSLGVIDNITENIIFQYLFDEEIGIAIKKDDPLAKKAIKKNGFKYPWISINSIEKRPFVFPHDFQQMSFVIADIFRSAGINLKPQIRSSTAMSQIDCVAYGNVLAIVPETLVRLGWYNDQLTLLSFGDKPLLRRWTLFYHKDHFISKPLKELMDLTIEKYKNIL